MLKPRVASPGGADDDARAGVERALPATVRILGIWFLDGTVADAIEVMALRGGLMVVPAAPALAEVSKDRDYYAALLESDLAIPDSGLMTLAWNIATLKGLRRVSGLEFLVALLDHPAVREPGALFLVNPSRREQEINIAYLRGRGIEIGEEDCYVAPMYGAGAVEDPRLLALLARRKPRFVVINLGGGTQEKLGKYLRDHLDYRPALLCTGAALAFLTGQQSRIPMWADRFFLGWLFRCLREPRRFVPRYLRGLRLVPLLVRYGSRMVPPRRSSMPAP